MQARNRDRDAVVERVRSLLELINGEGRMPTAGEKLHIINALSNLYCGMFSVAWLNVELAETMSDRTQTDSLPAGARHFTVEDFRRCLMEIERSSVPATQLLNVDLL